MGDVANYDATNAFVFDAKLMNDGYLATAQRASYFYHQHRRDLSQPVITDIPTLYERETHIDYAPFSDFFTMYKPIQQTANTATPHICVFKGTDSLFDIVKDLSILRAYYTNNFLSTTASTTYNQLDSLISLLKPLFEGNSHAVHFISHSLGSTLANYVAYKLVSTSSQIRTQGLTQTMFAPYLLVDHAYQYFRDVDINTYNVKTHLQIHTINGDWVTGLVSTYGIGTVNKYDIVLSPIVPDTTISIHTEGYLSWLSEVLDYPQATSSSAIRALSYHIDWHKMSNFNTDAIELVHIESNYQHILAMANYATLGLTIQSAKVYDLQHFLSTVAVPVNVQLMLTASLDGTTFNTDYPHVVGGAMQDIDAYRWTASILAGQKGNYKKSINDMIVNFPLLLTNKSDTNVTMEVVLIKQGTYWDVIKPDETIQYGIKNRGDISDLTNAPTITGNSVTAVANLSVGVQERYRFNVIEGWVHAGPRRDLHIQPPLYTGLRATFADPASGVQLCYVKHGSRFVVALEGYSNSQNYSVSWPTWHGQYGISWNDNTEPSDEHVWKIIANSNNTYTIQNTQRTDTYIGKQASTIPQITTYTVPELELSQVLGISISTDINATVVLKGNTQDYPMFIWHSGSSNAAGYGYVDYYPLRSSGYVAGDTSQQTITLQYLQNVGGVMSPVAPTVPAIMINSGSGIIITGN